MNMQVGFTDLVDHMTLLISLLVGELPFASFLIHTIPHAYEVNVIEL